MEGMRRGLSPGGGRPGRGPCPGPGAPRLQAHQRNRRRGGTRPRPRLRPGATGGKQRGRARARGPDLLDRGLRAGRLADDHGHAAGNARLHATRADAGSGSRCTQRSVQLLCVAVRGGVRPASLRGYVRAGTDALDDHGQHSIRAQCEAPRAATTGARTRAGRRARAAVAFDGRATLRAAEARHLGPDAGSGWGSAAVSLRSEPLGTPRRGFAARAHAHSSMASGTRRRSRRWRKRSWPRTRLMPRRPGTECEPGSTFKPTTGCPSTPRSARPLAWTNRSPKR